MLHSLRHRAPTKRAGDEVDGHDLPGEKDSYRSNFLKPKTCRAIRTRPSLKGVYAVFYRCCLIAFGGVMLMVLIILQSSYMMGDGYSSNGGVIGDLADRWILESYVRQQEIKRRQGILYPDVQIKATRRMERAHYSQYLEEILRDHQRLKTSVGPPITAQLEPSQTTIDHLNGSTQSNVVKISGATASFAVSKANDLMNDLREERCHSNWMCQRCLNAPFRGSYEACAALCRRCYVRILSTIPGRNTEPIRITGVPVGDRIPRIIHQAWHFYPNSSEYPEISRLMAGWRAAKGYQYHFYDGYQAQTNFVRTNFPPLIEKALDAIPSRVGRLAFVRLLVLYKLGGVFVDVDLMLETNLDIVLGWPTTFVASRSPGLLDNCLWVGFIAAAPGHPVIARSIENIIRSLLLGMHTNSVALERDLMGNCANPYVAEIWKFRSQKADYLFKDCSLGLAYNQILGSPSVTSTIKPTTVDGGFQKILLMVHDDAGATRLTDLSANLLVASCNTGGASDISVQQRSMKYIQSRKRGRQENAV